MAKRFKARYPIRKAGDKGIPATSNQLPASKDLADRVAWVAENGPLADKLDSIPDRTDDGSRLTAPAHGSKVKGKRAKARAHFATTPDDFIFDAVYGAHYMQVGAQRIDRLTYRQALQQRILGHVATWLDTLAGDSAGSDLDAAIAACELIASIRAELTPIKPASVRSGEVLLMPNVPHVPKTRSNTNVARDGITPAERASITANVIAELFG